MPTTVNRVEIPRNALIVSVQADADSPLSDTEALVFLARAVQRGGAFGVRVDSPETISAVRAAIELPILGINKVGDRSGVFITPTFETARAAAAAGADIVALDGTDRPRPGGEQLSDIIARIHDELGVAVMADIDSVASGEFAAAAGADYLGTTLAGYTGGTIPSGPDLELVAELASRTDRPVIAEGRLHTPENVRSALDAGAWAVVVGQAITSPEAIIRRFRAVL